MRLTEDDIHRWDTRRYQYTDLTTHMQKLIEEASIRHHQAGTSAKAEAMALNVLQEESEPRADNNIDLLLNSIAGVEVLTIEGNWHAPKNDSLLELKTATDKISLKLTTQQSKQLLALIANFLKETQGIT